MVHALTDQHEVHFSAVVAECDVGLRLDQALAGWLPDYSRACLAGWIKTGHVALDGVLCQLPKTRLRLAQRVLLLVDAPQSATRWVAQALPLTIVYEDEDVLVVNKPAGLVVHPGAGQPDGTLVNGLLHYDPALEALPRAGLIHRLDKDTTGLLVVARTLKAHHHLVQQLQARQMQRVYEALVHGVVRAGGVVDAPLGRHPSQRTRRAVLASGQAAVTHYQVLTRFKHFSHIQCQLETGRTHQIRVHMAHIRHPLVGDPVYGKTVAKGCLSAELQSALQHFKRQALHAKTLGFTHPSQGEWMAWSCPCPADFFDLLHVMQAANQNET